MSSKLLIASLVIQLLFLSGCSKPEPESGSGSGSQTSEPAAPAVLNTTPIKIGDVMTYSQHVDFTRPTKQGWQLALEEINATGGVLGRPLEVVSIDAKGEPGGAVTAVQDLKNREGVELMMGAFLSNVGLSISETAKREGMLFMATWCGTEKLLWGAGHDLVFRIQPSTAFYGQVLADEAKSLTAKRWATLAPNYEAGHAFTEAFVKALEQHRRDLIWVGEYWPALNGIDAGAIVQALKRDNPEAMFVHVYGSDLFGFIREGSLRGLFTGRKVLSLTLGFRENWGGLGSEMPEGWTTFGYPSDSLTDSRHLEFVNAYQARWSQEPTSGSLFGYLALSSLANAIQRSGSTQPEKVREALLAHALDSPVGPLSFRAVDQQSSLGVWLGKTSNHEGKPAFIDAAYKTGDQYYPSDEFILNLRNGN